MRIFLHHIPDSYTIHGTNGIFWTYIWSMFLEKNPINVGKYTMHGCYLHKMDPSTSFSSGVVSCWWYRNPVPPNPRNTYLCSAICRGPIITPFTTTTRGPLGRWYLDGWYNSNFQMSLFLCENAKKTRDSCLWQIYSDKFMKPLVLWQ